MLLDRRSFLRSLGLVGASTVVGCRGAPLERMYAYLTPPEEIVPGVAAFYATVCRACPAGCGILVKTREARPIKLEGNPAHPVNRGTLCARGQAFIQSLYGPNRVTRPMVRRDGKLTACHWSEAYGKVTAALKDAKRPGLLSGLQSGAFDEMMNDLAGSFGTFEHVMYEPVALASMAAASSLVFGAYEVPSIRLQRASHVVSLGADLLDGWISPVRFSREWAQNHAFAQGRGLRMHYAGPRRNLTATAADGFVRVPAEAVGTLALALLYEVLERKKGKVEADELATVRAMAADLGKKPALEPELHKAVSSMASALDGAKVGLVLQGGAEVTGADATAVHAAALLTSHLCGATGQALAWGTSNSLTRVAPEKKVVEVLERAAAGDTDVLMVHDTNPAYTLPGGVGVSEKLQEAPMVVALAWEHSETTEAADVVLPVHHPLESWGDYQVEHGVTGLMQPVRTPLYRTRHPGDLILKLARISGHDPHRGSFKDYVVRRATEAMPEERFDEMLVQGGIFDEPPPQEQPKPRSDIRRLPAVKTPGEGQGARLSVTLSASLHDGRGTTQDWLMEVPDSVNQTAWEVPAQLGEKLARAAGVKSGDRVELSTQAGSIQAVAVVDPEMADGQVSLPMGGGRRYGREEVATGSASVLLPASYDPESGELVRCGIDVKVTRKSGGILTTVMGSDRSEGRKLALSMDEKDAREGRFPVFTRHGEKVPDEHGHVHGHKVPMPHQDREGEQTDDNIVELVEHPEHRWGLVVDLDRCTGCGACVVACYAENNVMVVGSERVRQGREMSWLRIERHAFGDEDSPEVRFLPVMCQHCAQAPCETVCPVFAPYHTPDGLNAQIYNRCIGTRYCANNCPYKVRRFNFFKYEREGREKEQLNPDVTVRHRGVMEKCTFCIQRIREATNRAKNEGRPLSDGEITPACVQTCPTGALIFGDYKLKESRMSVMARDPRGYRMLDYFLNTRPAVVYLRRVHSHEEDS